MKLSLIHETLAYKKKPGWTPTDDTPLGIMGDKAQDSGVQAQDFQAVLLRFEQRLIKQLSAIMNVCKRNKQEIAELDGSYNEEDITRREHLAELTHSINTIREVLWRDPDAFKEYRRRIGITRQGKALSALTKAVRQAAAGTIYRLNNYEHIIRRFPEPSKYFDEIMATLTDFRSTVDQMMRSRKFESDDEYLPSSNWAATVRGWGSTEPGERKKTW